MDLSAILFELWESNLSSSYLYSFQSVSPEPSHQTIPAIHIYFARRARALIGLRGCACLPIAQRIAINIHLAAQMMYVIWLSKHMYVIYSHVRTLWSVRPVLVGRHASFFFYLLPEKVFQLLYLTNFNNLLPFQCYWLTCAVDRDC